MKILKLIILLSSTFVIFNSTAFATETITLSDSNTVIFNGDVDANSVLKLALDYDDISQKTNDTIYIIMNSGGGELTAGYAIINSLNKFPNLRAKFIVLYAASMAAGIVEGVNIERLAIEDSVMLFHEFGYGICSDRLYRKKQLKEMIVDWEKTQSEFANLFWKRMKMSKKEYSSKIKDKDWILRGKELLKYNAVDKIVKLDCVKGDTVCKLTDLINSK